MTRQSRIDGMSQLHPPLVGIQIQTPAHKDLQQIDRLLQSPAAIPVPCPQNSGMLAMETNLHHPHDLNAVSPTTTHRVAAPTIHPSSQFVMIGMMKMSGIS
jgi:hypothetical protein